MKKLLALILACMLPCAAIAQTTAFRVSLMVSEDVFVSELLQRFAEEDGNIDEAAAFLSIAAELLDGAKISVVSQDDAATIEIHVSGKKLLALSMYVDDRNVCLSSDLMPGYAALFPLNEDEDVTISQNDWERVSASIISSVLQWAQGITYSSSYGAFAGDAYSGGTRCETIVLDDRSLASLFQTVMTPEVRNAFETLIEPYGIDPAEVCFQLDSLHQKAAENNEHRYVIRYVTSDSYEPVGISITILRDGVQLATASFGFGEDMYRLVIGTGKTDRNLWYDHYVQYTEGDSRRYEGKCLQFAGAKDEDFAYAAAVTETFISSASWKLDLSETENMQTWYFEHEAAHDVGQEQLISISQFEASQSCFSNTTMLLLNGSEIASMEVSALPCDTIQPMQNSLVVCDFASQEGEHMALQNEIIDMVIQNLYMRLMKILPTELLMQLN